MLLALLAACGPDDTAGYTEADLTADIAGYAGWSHPAEWPGTEPSCEGAHGDYVQIWQNETVDADLAADRAWSEGAIFVLEGYQDTAGTPKAFVAMRKAPGAAGAWFWGHYDEAHAPIDAGDLAGCAACHSAGPGRVRHVGDSPPETLAACREDTGGRPPG